MSQIIFIFLHLEEDNVAFFTMKMFYSSFSIRWMVIQALHAVQAHSNKKINHNKNPLTSS